MLHGRGADAADILSLQPYLSHPDIAYLAPEAPGNAWYPFSFLAPFEQNEPQLSNALQTVADAVKMATDAGIPHDKIFFMGFSQGACLSLEYAARNANKFAGILGFSGGLIGPEGTDFSYSGSLEGTPVFLGCSDRDPHIPLHRVEKTAEVLSAMGAEVNKQIYPNMPHTIIEEEIVEAKKIIEAKQ